MVKAVFFDLDGTLYDRDALVLKIVEEQFVTFQKELQGLGETHFVQRIVQLDDHGYGDKVELYGKVALEWGLPSGVSGRLIDHFWSSYDRNCQLTEDTFGTLQTLRAHGKKLGVITNGRTMRQRQKLVCLGLEKFFDAVLISESEGVRKPDPAIFNMAAERCGVNSRESVFVGDHPEVDVAGSGAAGFIPIWKRVPYWRMGIENVQTVGRLSEILPICLAG
jgi:putative hydrolase of the HAD superfamily